MMWSTCGGPDFIEIHQSGIKKHAWWRQMPDRRHTADGKTGLRAHECCIGLVQWLARQSAGLDGIDAIATCGNKQNRVTACCTHKNDGFRDLVYGTANGLRCIRGGARQSSFTDVLT